MDETVSNSLPVNNGGRQVARFNVSAPFRVSESPAGDEAEDETVAETVGPSPAAAGGQRERRSVSPSRFNVEFVDEQTPHGDDGAPHHPSCQ